MSRIATSIGAVAALLLAGAAPAAYAAAGDGIRIGGTDGRLHPYVDLETRYDSNVSYSDAGKQLGDYILHVRPGFEVKVPSDRAAFEFSGALDLARYLGVEGDTGDLSKWYAEAGMAILVNRRSPVSVRIDNDFRRSVSTSSLAFASAVVANSNALAVSVPWRPGGGALVVTGRGAWILESYSPYLETDSAVALSDLGYNEFRGGLDAQWKFLPRTTALFQGGYFARTPNAPNPDGSNEVSGFDVLGGFTGLVTQHIGLSIKGGLGRTLQSTGDASTWLTDVSGEWIPTDSASLRMGYTHNYGIDPTGSVYASNGLNAGGRVRIASRYTARASIRWDRLTFDRLPGARADFFRLEPGVDAYLTRWLTASLAYAHSRRDNAQFPAAQAVPNYSKNEAWLKLGFTY
jgi:hypothetical protein